MRPVISLLFAVLFALPAAAQEAPTLAFPLACSLGETCWVYQYPDTDPGPGWRDYRGGKMSYDGHDGTDIGVEDIDDIETGIPVLAAADGTVFRLRDGVPDRIVTDETREATSRIGCGNAVLLEHGGGWTTIYCHLKRGSVMVAEGDSVRTGDPLGFLGLSGLTEFPHLEFQVRKDNQVVDPNATGLWATDEIARAYGPVVLHVGFAKQAPEKTRIIAGDYEPAELTRDGGNFLFYVTVLGAAPGQTLSLAITGPDGRRLAGDEISVDRAQILRTNWIGLRDISGLDPGTYRATAVLTEGDGGESSRTADVTLLP
ncbi:MAG: M23 family metallopeptidase [Alphaproteobacteria bacterium]|nr:M23 family metallopeptidase [Alphaproteobacteria bacterium]